MFALFSCDPSSNPTEEYIFCRMLLERNENKQKVSYNEKYIIYRRKIYVYLDGRI